MNEASAGRFALAQQLTPHYSASPKVATVAVAGSVARGDADRFSDIDLAVFWVAALTEQERREISKHARGRHVQLDSYSRDEARWLDRYEVGRVAIDVRHAEVEAIERILADVLERCDPSLSRQQHLAALLTALPLSDPSSVLTHWQSRATAYPRRLSWPGSAHLRVRPAWEQEKLVERVDLLALYESFCAVEKQILLVLMGLNRLYYPGWQWVDRLMAQMRIAPLKLAPLLPGLEFVLLEHLPHALVADLLDYLQFDQAIGYQAQAPVIPPGRRHRTDERDHVRFLFPV